MDILIKKAGRAITVEPEKAPDHVREYIEAYGWRQKLNDSISGYSTKGSEHTELATADQMFAIVEGVLERLYAGDVKAGRVAMPKTAEGIARREAYETVVNKWLANEHASGNKSPKLKDFANREELAARYFEKNRDTLMRRAQESLDMEVDLDELAS
jgi:hypothetical protein